jgi:hypothetical protein
MAGRRKSERFPWWAALAGSTLVVAGGLALLRFPAPPDPRRVEEGTRGGAMRIARVGEGGEQDARLQEELALQDPTPLFLPTRWNSGQANQAVQRDPPVVFSGFLPKLQFSNDDPDILIPAPGNVPAGPLEAVDLVERGPRLLELGRLPLEMPPVTPRLARLEVSHAGTGQVLIALNLSGGGVEATALRQELWAPIEVLIAVSPAGLVGRPALIASSGSERVDNWVLDYLRGSASLGARLPPGFYRVLLGP